MITNVKLTKSKNLSCLWVVLLCLFTLTKLSGQDSFEPNNAFNEAKSVALGSTSTGTIHQNNDVDYFKVTTTKGGVISAHIPINNTTLFFRIQIYLENTSDLVADEYTRASGGPVTTEAVVPAGTYFIVVFSNSGGSNGNPYSLTINFDESDKCEWNHTFATACEISPNTTLDVALRGTYFPDQSNDDIDIYKVTVTRGGVLSVNIPPHSADLFVRVRIIAENANDILAEEYARQSGGTVSAEAVVPAGAYYIQLFDNTGRLHKNTFKVNVSFDIEDDKEWNNTYATANVVNNNTSFKAKIRGTYFPLQTNDDIDYYKISFTQSSTLKVNIPLHPTELYLRVRILSESDLKVIADEYSRIGGGPVSLETNVSTGNYYIEIFDNTGRTHPNAYTVNIGNPTSPPPVPCVLPQTYILSATALTANTATLNSGMTGFAEYEFNYRVVGTLNWSTGTSTSGVLNITSLNANTNYEFRVRVKCADGSSSDWTSNHPFTTTGNTSGNTCVLPQVFTLSASNITATTATLNSGIVATGFINFEFNYRKEGTTAWTSAFSSSSSVNISGLSALTRYEFRVRVQCSNNVWSDWMGVQTFTTLNDVVNPPPPTGATNFYLNKTEATRTDTALVVIKTNGFKDIGGFQFSVAIPSGKASIVAVDYAKSIAGLQARQVDPQRWGFIWFDPNLVAKTLADGSDVITLKVIFNGELSESECIPIIFDGNPTEIAATTLINQNVNEFIPSTTNGELCLVSTATVSGTVKNSLGVGISQVKVNIGNSFVYTNDQGVYSLPNLSVLSSYSISASKSGGHKNGVNVVDIVTIRQHILGSRIFDTPFKYIASDVNFSGSVNVVDVVLIQQLILGQIDSLSRNWVFIPGQQQFSTAESAIKTKFSEIVGYSKLPGDITQDFFGVKIGDANHSAAVKNQWLKKPGLQLPAWELTLGETNEIPVYAWNLEQIQGFQLKLFADPNALRLLAIRFPNGSLLTKQNFDLSQLDQGKVKLLWVQALNQHVAPLQNNQVLFYLKVQARAATQLSEVISIQEDDFENLFTNQDLEWNTGRLFFDPNLMGEAKQRKGATHLIYPNPSVGNATPVLQLDTDQRGAYVVEITDVAGRQIRRFNFNALPGRNRESLVDMPDAAGVYHYRILLNGQVLMGKFIRSNP